MSRLRTLGWGVAVVVLASPPLDPWLDRAMPRLLLLEMPAWVALGWLSAGGLRRRLRAFDPRGVAGLVFFLGALGFWMIPRSVDLVGTSALGNQLMHASLLAAGAALRASLRALPFVLRGALGIYGASMTFALGMIYSRYSALLCGTFDLVQQKTTGRWLLMICPIVVFLVVTGGARSLARAHLRSEASAGDVNVAPAGRPRPT